MKIAQFAYITNNWNPVDLETIRLSVKEPSHHDVLVNVFWDSARRALCEC